MDWTLQCTDEVDSSIEDGLKQRCIVTTSQNLKAVHRSLAKQLKAMDFLKHYL